MSTSGLSEAEVRALRKDKRREQKRRREASLDEETLRQQLTQAGLTMDHYRAVARTTSIADAITLAPLTLTESPRVRNRDSRTSTSTWLCAFTHGQLSLTGTATHRRDAAKGVIGQLRALVTQAANPNGERGEPRLPPQQAETADAGADRAAPPPKRSRGPGVQRREEEARHAEYQVFLKNLQVLEYLSRQVPTIFIKFPG
eukprot:SAG31_NODE_677_length_12894_cov_4.083548_2_plen_201_part_00